MRCFIPSLLPALPVHPTGGEPSAAGSDEGDWHEATCIMRCEEEAASHIHTLTLHVSGNFCMYSIPWAVCNGYIEGEVFISWKTCPIYNKEMHHPMHEIECFIQYILNCVYHLRQFVEITFPPSSGVLISTTATFVALLVAIVAVLGVVTAVLSWQNFKLKQKGMLGHMDDIVMNVSTCSWQVLVLPFSFSLPTNELLPLLPSPSSSPQRPWQHSAPAKSQLLFSGEGPSVTMQ